MERLKRGKGWLPDLPHHRDFHPEHEQVKRLLAGFKISDKKKDIPVSIDLREWFSPVEDQGFINSCTAHCGTALLEYYENKAFGKYINASRLFLYKTSKDLLKKTGNADVFLRTAMEAMTLFGVPPEEYWPYDPDKSDDEPPPSCYTFAENYKAIKYFKLDPPGFQYGDLLKRIKQFLAHCFPVMFGFTTFNSINDDSVSQDGKIPYPNAGDLIQGGHALVAAGYDDNMKICHQGNEKETPTTGALLIRNSWGTDWGDKGYGWLPYKYVSDGLAKDWWSLLKSHWVETNKFGLI